MSVTLVNVGTVANDGTGDQPRTFGQNLNKHTAYPFFNVAGYGAAVDGTTDDTAAWKAAIADVPTKGGIVYQPPGVSIVSATLAVPTDRLVGFLGAGDLANDNGTVSGSVLRAAASFTGTDLLAQTGVSTAQPCGMQLRGLVLDGNNTSLNLLHITDMQACRIRETTFYNSTGNGLLLTGACDNFHITTPRFFELGNTTAYPNGTSALAMVSTADGSCADIWVTQPHFEVGRGSYWTCYDPTGTNPISGVVCLGGKMEWSGNAALGFNPAAGIGMPFLIPGNVVQSQWRGMEFINGYANAAWHIYVTNCSQTVFDTYHVTSPATLSDSQLPTYYVNHFSGSNNTIRGTYIRGAASGTSGAHIRVTGTGSGVTIDPSNMYVSPASGVPVLINNLATNNLGPLTIAQQIARGAVTITYNAALAVNAAVGEYQIVTLTGNTTVGVPSNPVTGQRLTTTIIQDGTGGRTVAWNAVFKNSWSDTGNTLSKRSTISHIYDGTNWNQDGAQTPYV